MSIKRPNTSGITKSGSAISDVPDAPTSVTATGGDGQATVTFTAAVTGGTPTSYTATSTPGSITASGTSPITVTGLTNGTSYTFTVTATNSTGSAVSSASSSVTPAWVPTGLYESIATTTLNSTTSTVTFSSIPQTFTHLQLRVTARSSSASSGGTYMTMQFNSDTGTNYSMHGVGGDGASTFAEAYSSTLDQVYVQRLPRNGSTASVHAGIVIDILDYASTNKYKTSRALGGYDANGSGWIELTSGNWRNTNAITTITLKSTGGSESFLSDSKFALYGIKG